jgi:glycosyltransferase involved in cell wall biosynthesis
VRVLLFEWTAGGHHPVYVRRFAEALADLHDVTVALPDELRGVHDELPAGVALHPLGPARPAWDHSRSVRAQRRELADRELDLLSDAIAAIQPDRAIHLSADPVLRRLLRRGPLGAPLAACVHHPRAHYPADYGQSQTAVERIKAVYFERVVARWRRRADAQAVYGWDDVAVHRWQHRRGAAAQLLPEPPLPPLPDLVPLDDRRGCVMYGALRPAKGIDLLADAIAAEPTGVRVLLAGALLDPAFRTDLDRYVAAMRAAGANVDLRAHHHTEPEGLRAISEARCLVLPFMRHPGHSRTMVEACAVGTPIVAHHGGLVGHVVREHGLGVTADCANPSSLRAAVLSLTEDPEAPARYAPALRAFADRSRPERFRADLLAPLDGAPAAVSGVPT